MRVLSTRSHGYLDAAAGVLLLAAPFLLGFGEGGAETWVPLLAGIAVLATGAVTDYEMGLVKRIQMTAHLWVDAVAGLLLGVSPWLFAFDNHVWIPHLAIGLVLIGAAALTDTIPGYERRGGTRAEG